MGVTLPKSGEHPLIGIYLIVFVLQCQNVSNAKQNMIGEQKNMTTVSDNYRTVSRNTDDVAKYLKCYFGHDLSDDCRSLTAEKIFYILNDACMNPPLKNISHAISSIKSPPSFRKTKRRRNTAQENSEAAGL